MFFSSKLASGYTCSLDITYIILPRGLVNTGQDPNKIL